MKENQISRRTYYTSTSVLGQMYDKVVRNVDRLGYKPEGMAFFLSNTEIINVSRKFKIASSDDMHLLHEVGNCFDEIPIGKLSQRKHA